LYKLKFKQRLYKKTSSAAKTIIQQYHFQANSVIWLIPCEYSEKEPRENKMAAATYRPVAG
jgi:hypothetical protein